VEISGNLRDEILVETSKALMRDDTWANHGVPYRQRGILYVNSGIDGTSATLSIESGVTVAFDESAGSGNPAAGDWMGVVSRYVPTVGSTISYAHIEYAGGDSGHDSSRLVWPLRGRRREPQRRSGLGSSSSARLSCAEESDAGTMPAFCSILSTFCAATLSRSK
jgi:hypothetical protein